MSEKSKSIIRKIIEAVIYLAVGAGAATGIINYDKITNVVKKGEEIKAEQTAQAYSADTTKTMVKTTTETAVKK